MLPDLGLSVTEAANQLGVSRVALSRAINGRAAISADMVIRLAQWLGGSAVTWLCAQVQSTAIKAERKLAAEARAKKTEYVWKRIEGRSVRQGVGLSHPGSGDQDRTIGSSAPLSVRALSAY